MNIPLKQWSLNEFGFCPTNSTLARYVNLGLITPMPFKFAGKWFVDENAVYNVPKPNTEVKHVNPVLQRIMNNATT